MKKGFILLSVVVVIASCTKLLDELITFKFTRDTSFTLPGSSSLGVPIGLSTPEVQTSYESEFANNNTSTDKVEYVKVTDMKLQVTNPAAANFNFLKSIEISISADGLADKVIASKNDIQNDNVQELSLDVSEEDLKPYLTKDTYRLKISAVTDEVITQDYEMNIATTFEVKGKIN